MKVMAIGPVRTPVPFVVPHVSQTSVQACLLVDILFSYKLQSPAPSTQDQRVIYLLVK